MMPTGTYEARVQCAHLPLRTVAFTFPEKGIPFCSGMFRIEYLRPATPEDQAAFPIPDDEICSLCGCKQELE